MIRVMSVFIGATNALGFSFTALTKMKIWHVEGIEIVKVNLKLISWGEPAAKVVWKRDYTKG